MKTVDKSKILIIISLFIVILTSTAYYATSNKTVKLSNVDKFESKEANVRLDKVEAYKTSGSALDVESSTDGKRANIKFTLKEAGDSITYMLIYRNEGNQIVKVSDIIGNYDTKIENNPYLKYELVGARKGELYQGGDEIIFEIKFSYDDEENTTLVTEDIDLEVVFKNRE